MRTTERQRDELRHRAIKPHDEFGRRRPFQIRLTPEETLALLDDLDECLVSDPDSRTVLEANGLLVQARDLLAQLKGGARGGVHRDITRYLEARSDSQMTGKAT